MLYEDYETRISYDMLSKVIPVLPAPVCLLGGWAVYYTVNTNYTVDTGTSYHGSKDIDLGFHLERDATKESLRESTLAKTIESLKDLEFSSIGMRLLKEYHRETHIFLSGTKAKKTHSYNIFQLYVDLLVDNIPDGTKEALEFTPFDEKRLTHVFKGKMFKTIDEFPIRVIVPTPPVLLSMKIASLPDRTKDHKKYKDIMDVYALIWYSGVPMKRLRLDVSRLVSDHDMSKMMSSISRDDYVKAADALDIDVGTVESVIKDFVRAPGTMRQDKDKWPIPTNMSYDRLIDTARALLLLRADQKAVEIEMVSKKVGIAKDTIRRGLLFLKSLGVVEISKQGKYSLTADGTSYAKAHVSGDANQVVRLTLGIIGRSHLTELSDVIKTNKSISWEYLYKKIKVFGRYPDGKGGAKMHAPDATGARTVLRLFEDAGLLDKTVSASKDMDGDPPKDNKGKQRNSRPGPRGGKKQGSPEKVTVVSAGADEMDDHGVLVVRGVGQVQVNDLETLKVAEIYMDILRKKLSDPSSSRIERTDTH